MLLAVPAVVVEGALQCAHHRGHLRYESLRSVVGLQLAHEVLELLSQARKDDAVVLLDEGRGHCPFYPFRLVGLRGACYLAASVAAVWLD